MNLKKLILPNLPYILFVYLFDKVAQAFRLTPGADLSAKLLSIGDGFSAAFSNMAPSFHMTDLAIGIAGAVILRMAVYMRSKNAKKYATVSNTAPRAGARRRISPPLWTRISFRISP